MHTIGSQQLSEEASALTNAEAVILSQWRSFSLLNTAVVVVFLREKKRIIHLSCFLSFIPRGKGSRFYLQWIELVFSFSLCLRCVPFLSSRFSWYFLRHYHLVLTVESDNKQFDAWDAIVCYFYSPPSLGILFFFFHLALGEFFSYQASLTDE